MFAADCPYELTGLNGDFIEAEATSDRDRQNLSNLNAERVHKL